MRRLKRIFNNEYFLVFIFLALPISAHEWMGVNLDSAFIATTFSMVLGLTVGLIKLTKKLNNQ